MKKLIIPSILAATIFCSCSKSDNDTNNGPDFTTLKTYAITDFVNKIALPAYAELKVKGATLNTAVINLNTSATDENLAAAKAAWKDIRSTWEKTEGFLFGPVEDDEYDPDTDTWPVSFNDMNALLADMSHSLDVADIQGLQRDLKGYHPIEYILWGQNGNRTAASLTAREKLYIVSLTANLKAKADALQTSWDPASGNYGSNLLTAGAGSTLFITKKSVFITLTDGMLGICGEVGNGKMKEPYDAQDPNIVESPFSGNSTTDFKNNIIGAYNVYLGKFNEDGYGLEDLIKAKNSALNATIKQKFEAAIGSFDAITVPYEQAILTQRTQCLATMTAINSLATTLDTDLRAFIVTNITD